MTAIETYKNQHLTTKETIFFFLAWTLPLFQIILWPVCLLVCPDVQRKDLQPLSIENVYKNWAKGVELRVRIENVLGD